jgi:CRP-like cAMP-binding protein
LQHAPRCLPWAALTPRWLQLEPVYFASGQKIMSCGEPGDYFYILIDGEVVITVDDGKEVARRKTNEYFGEVCAPHAAHELDLRVR